MKILMEDWLIGCVRHDGRHGEVILQAIKVLEIADYIRRTRTSLTDGCLEISPTDEFVEKELKKVLKRNLEQTFPIAEQTEPSTEPFNELWCNKKIVDCVVTDDRDTQVLDGWQTREKPKTSAIEPSTDCGWK